MRVPALASAALMLLSCAARADGYQSRVDHRARPDRLAISVHALWVAALGRTAMRSIKGRDFDVSENPAQVLESLDFAWMSYMQARRGAVTLFSDVIYADVSNSGSFASQKPSRRMSAGTLGRRALVRLPLLDRRGGRHVRDQPLEAAAITTVARPTPALEIAGRRSATGTRSSTLTWRSPAR